MQVNVKNIKIMYDETCMLVVKDHIFVQFKRLVFISAESKL